MIHGAFTADAARRHVPRQRAGSHTPVTVQAAPGAAPLALAAASDDDFEALLSLRMAAMRESLQRLGRVDPQRARERLSRAFEPAHTRHILQGGERVGFVVLLPVPAVQPDHLVLDHPYIAPQAQRQGVGSWVMTQVLFEADRLGLAVRLTALQLSGANRFYEHHHGFELQHTGEWDLHDLRTARGTADDRQH